MIKKIPGEVWKQILFTGHKQLRKKYAVSSHGRAASYNDGCNKRWQIIEWIA